jgi:hypothetical protein
VEIKFSLTQDDWLVFSRYQRAGKWRKETQVRSVPVQIHPVVGIFIGVTIVAGLYFVVDEVLQRIDWTSPVAVGICTFLGTLGLLIGISGFVTDGYVKRHYAMLNAKGLVDNATMSICPESVVYSTRVSSEWTDWCVVEYVGHTDDHTVILVTEMYGYIIPWRAFSSRADAQLFLETAERYWNARRARGAG